MAKSKTTKPAIPTPAAPAKGPGVIAALIDLLQNGGGNTKELYQKLAERFPDRTTEKGGMRVTISVQLKALHKKGRIVVTSEQVADRGHCLQRRATQGEIAPPLRLTA